jgi:Mg-chelatase subunit ChlD
MLCNRFPSIANVGPMFSPRLHAVGFRSWSMQVRFRVSHRYNMLLATASLSLRCRPCGVADATGGNPNSVIAAQSLAATQSLAAANSRAYEEGSARTARARACAAKAAAELYSLLSSDCGQNFNRDLPSSSDVILSCASSSSELCITLEAVEKPRRNPIHCIVVLDVSGSMDSPATQTASDASQESQVTFSRLDLAKHSSKVIVEVLGDEDSVTILTFSTQAKVKLQQTRMTAEGERGPSCCRVRNILTHCTGKLQAQAAIESLQTEGSTNLIAANKLALLCAQSDAISPNIHIVVLTDGEPDSSSSVLNEFTKAIAPLEEARAAGHHHGVCVSTFGFGYDMNSVRSPQLQPPPQPAAYNFPQELLLHISVAGHGMFSYIPDASMIGTVFCNFIANAMYAPPCCSPPPHHQEAR